MSKFYFLLTQHHFIEGFNMTKAIIFFMFVLTCFSLPQKDIDFRYQSYLAHISATNASLRLNEKVEAERWLQNAKLLLVSC